MKEQLDDVFLSEPDAKKRLGADVFVETPLYPSKTQHRPVYINQDLFYQLTGIKEKLSWQQMSDIITHYFSTTIEPEKASGKAISTAYVDRQADPLDLSLSGNLGSGRAYYKGKYFNIKGEKTLLAQSKKRRFSDGLLEMERSIWEALIANSLQGSISTGLNTVLAILDMNEQCDVIWRDEEVCRGKIIRVDTSGQLDRVTHVFYNKTPMTQIDLRQCATKFGQLEADKFIERISHGTWSAGNISAEGHLIDFDTVCAVKGRVPTYSSTQWFADNRFGFEYAGQLKILKSLVDDADINRDQVKYDDLENVMMSARQDHLAKRFVGLMGFTNEQLVFEDFKGELTALVELFIILAQKNYQKPNSFSSKEALSNVIHIFDFSLFFRFYPLLKRAKEYSLEHCLDMMVSNKLLDQPFVADIENYTEVEQEYIDQVYETIGDCFVRSEGELKLLKVAAVSFIKKYDILFEKMLGASKQNLKQIEAHAYVANEDRFYLFPYFTISYFLAEHMKAVSEKEISSIISTLILANQRNVEQKYGGYIADVRLFQQGSVFKVLTGKGAHCLAFLAYSQFEKIEDTLKVLIGTQFYTLDKNMIEGEVVYLSPEIKNVELLARASRDMSLQSQRITLYTHNEHIELTEFLVDE